MKAIVFHGIGDIRLDDVSEPKIEAPTDALVRITSSAICGTDLHMVRGTLPGMQPGTILGHEGVGVVEEVGKGVRNLRPGDRVVIPSTIACGACAHCRQGEYAQCDVANPNGPAAGTCFFGGPAETGPIHGLQAERARIPFAHVGLVRLPDQVSDDQAILISDVFPTGWFGAELAQVQRGDTVCVLGCGPVGMFAIVSAQLMGAARVMAVDCAPDRLDKAREHGAEAIDYGREDPLEVIRELTLGKGVDRVIDAVGVDAEEPHAGPARPGKKERARHQAEHQAIAPEGLAEEGWHQGDAPSQALDWAVEMVSKAGTVAVIGVYPGTMRSFPVGDALEKNLTLRLGNCHHRAYVPMLVDMVRSGRIDPVDVLTRSAPLESALEAYAAFDRREAGWLKVKLTLQGAQGQQRAA